MLEFTEQFEERQRLLAYKLWEMAGKPEGRQDEFWSQAASQLAQDPHKGSNDDVDKAGKDSFPANDPVNKT